MWVSGPSQRGDTCPLSLSLGSLSVLGRHSHKRIILAGSPALLARTNPPVVSLRALLCLSWARPLGPEG